MICRLMTLLLPYHAANHSEYRKADATMPYSHDPLPIMPILLDGNSLVKPFEEPSLGPPRLIKSTGTHDLTRPVEGWRSTVRLLRTAVTRLITSAADRGPESQNGEPFHYTRRRLLHGMKGSPVQHSRGTVPPGSGTGNTTKAF